VRFHLIDGIDAYEAGRWIRARKLAGAADEYWDRAGDQPVMPPELVLESLCQAGQWLLLASTGVKRRGTLVSVGEADFLTPVHPGDLVRLEARIERLDDESAVISGEASVGGQTILKADAVMAVLVDAAELEDPDDTRRMLEGLMGSRA
jgi:3-hydroxyacyl-[acyl-carrier-protein] dehydratase